MTARLIRSSDGATLWAFKSDESFADVFILQDVVSEKVARALAIEIGVDGRAQNSKQYTENVEAYQLYVRGVFLRNQLTEESLKKSIEFFQNAIDLDPQYALAYSGQASSYAPLAYMGFASVREAEAKNKELVSSALALDDSLAEAHAAAGERKLFFEWDFEGAEREFQRALELKPADELTHLLYPKVLVITGRPDEAVALARTVLNLNPLSPRVGMSLGRVYYTAGNYDGAISQLTETRELFPDYRLINLGPSYEQKSMYRESVNSYLEADAKWGIPAEAVETLRRAYSASGWRGFWEKRLELMKEAAKRSTISPKQFAEIYVRLGDNKKAIALLENAFNDRDMSLIFLGVDPEWKGLHHEPGFQDLLRRIRLSR